MTSEFYLGCPTNPEVCERLNQLFQLFFSEIKTKKCINNELMEQKGLIPIEINEHIVQAISSDLEYSYSLKKFKNENSPIGIYKIPLGYKKMN